MKHKGKKIIRFIQYFIIIILIVLITYIVYNRFVLKKTYITFFNHNSFIILSGSMDPKIHTKDFIVTEKKKDYDVGDIVAFYSGDTVTVHRIIESNEVDGAITYTTKGDFNNTADAEQLSPDKIIGAYEYTIPYLGSIIIYFCNNPMLLLMLLIFIIVIYIIIRMLIKQIKIARN